MRHIQKNMKPKQTGNVFSKIILMQMMFFLIYFLCFLLGSVIVFAINPPFSVQYEICMAALLIGALLCGFLAAKQQKTKGWLAGLLFCLPQNTAVMLLSLCFNRFSADWSVLFSSVIQIIASMLGGILAVNQKQKPKLKR